MSRWTGALLRLQDQLAIEKGSPEAIRKEADLMLTIQTDLVGGWLNHLETMSTLQILDAERAWI